MTEKKINAVFLCQDDFSSRTMYNGICDHINILKIICEKPIAKQILLKRRIKRLGLIKVIGQILFMIFNKINILFAKNRTKQLIKKLNLNTQPFPKEQTINVASINDTSIEIILKSLNPDVVIVNGTRIILPNILNAIKAPFINTHAGYTPEYRGVHGGYWSLVYNDHEHCGVTVHLVDQGIDTGNVLYQTQIYPTKQDQFNTYPVHQIGAAIPLMIKALDDLKKGNLYPVNTNNRKSTLWSHPTLYTYIKNWVMQGVR